VGIGDDFQGYRNGNKLLAEFRVRLSRKILTDKADACISEQKQKKYFPLIRQLSASQKKEVGETEP
jgi:hypothetical protein